MDGGRWTLKIEVLHFILMTLRYYKMKISYDYNGRPDFVKVCDKQFFRVHPYYWDDGVHYERMYRYIPLEESPVQEIWMGESIKHNELDDIIKSFKDGKVLTTCWIYKVPAYVSCIPFDTDINKLNTYIVNGPTPKSFHGYIVAESKIYLVYSSPIDYPTFDLGGYPSVDPVDPSDDPDDPSDDPSDDPDALDDLSYLMEGKTLSYIESSSASEIGCELPFKDLMMFEDWLEFIDKDFRTVSNGIIVKVQPEQPEQTDENIDMRKAALSVYETLFSAGFTREVLSGVKSLITSDDQYGILHDGPHRLAERILSSNLLPEDPLVSTDWSINNSALKKAGLKIGDRRRLKKRMAAGNTILKVATDYVLERIDNLGASSEN